MKCKSIFLVSNIAAALLSPRFVLAESLLTVVCRDDTKICDESNKNYYEYCVPQRSDAIYEVTILLDKTGLWLYASGSIQSGSPLWGIKNIKMESCSHDEPVAGYNACDHQDSSLMGGINASIYAMRDTFGFSISESNFSDLIHPIKINIFKCDLSI